MINDKSVHFFKNALWTSHFNRPLYENYAFSCIPSTIFKLLTGRGQKTLAADAVGGSFERFDSAILFLVDGFGWHFFEKYASKYPFLERFNREGVASKISSQFPSTTAAHITSINTGKEVGETGIYEWFYYEPLVDRMIAPLLFSYAGDHEAGTLLREGVAAEELFPFETLYQKLAKEGVRSVVFQEKGIAHSPYSKALLSGAEVIPFESFPEALDRLVELCHQPLKAATYFFIYFGDIDAVGHRYGISSEPFAEAVDFCWKAIEQRFWQKMARCPNKTAVMFTADHGMTPVHPKTTLLLNQVCPALSEMTRKNHAGLPLVPAGSCRDFFMHINEENLEEARGLLAKELNGVADVVLVQALLEQNFFGSKPASKRLKERIGNLVVLPYRNESVFWRFEKHKLEQHFYAAHGGLLPEEMESIFLYMKIGSAGVEQLFESPPV
jgi:Type I phosphodiesterase / nucleotide pyrophosphatase